MIAQAVAPASMDPAVIVLTGFNALAAAALVVFKVFDWFTGRTTQRTLVQPFRITQDPQVLTKAEHVEYVGHMDRRVVAVECRLNHMEHKMETDKTEIIRAGEERSIHIHNRINDLQSSIAAQPAQIVALLKNTKGLIE